MEYDYLDPRNAISTIKTVYRPRYILLNALFAAIYYYLMLYLVIIQKGTLFFIIPPILIYSLVLTSSVMMTIAVYAIRNTRNNKAKFSASGMGAGSVVVGSALCGCAYSFPILIATTLGVSFDGLLALKSFLVSYGVPLFSLLVVLNFLVIMYYLSRLSAQECRIRRQAGS